MSVGSTPKAKEDPLAKKQKEIAAAEWERYKQDFAPVEKDFIGATKAIGSQQEADYLQSMADVQRQQGIGNAPYSSGRLTPLIGRAQQQASSQIPEQSLRQSKARKAQGKETIIELGRNIGTGSLNRIGRQASIGTNANIAKAEAKNVRQAGISDAAGTLAGIGAYQYMNRQPGYSSGSKYGSAGTNYINYDEMIG